MDRTETHCTVTGPDNGEPLLLLHGTGPGASGAAFEPLTARLSGFRCFVPDLVGFGNSAHPLDVEPGPAPWLARRVEAVRRVLDERGVSRTHLLGHSYGCRVALELLKLEPQRYESVILLAAGGTPIKADLQRLTGFYADPTPQRMREIVLAQLATPDIPGLEEYVQHRVALAVRPEVRRSFEAAMGAGDPMPTNDAAVLAQISHRVLAVHGKQDATIPAAAATYLAEHLPHCDLHVFANAGHQLQMEVPDQLATIIGAFMRAPAYERTA